MAKKRHSGFTEPGEPTPQPWKLIVVNWGYQIIKGSRVIAAISGHASDKRKDPQAYADALLLAAAPELLSACEQSYSLLMEYGALASVGRGIDLRDILRDAIARARGE